MTTEIESDDEWIFDSIKRYDELFMYNLPGVVTSCSFSNNNNLVLSLSHDNYHEIWDLQVPELSLTDDVGVIKNRDFRLVAAGYSISSVKQIISENHQLISSENDGVHIYSVPVTTDDSDVIQHVEVIHKSVYPTLASNRNELYSCRTGRDILRHDLKTRINCPVTLTYENGIHGFVQMDSKSVGMHCHGNNLFVGLELTVLVVSNDRIVKVIAPCDGFTNILGSVAVSTNGYHVATADTGGKLQLYDLRGSCDLPFASYHVNGAPLTKLNVQFSPCGKYISTSGHGANVMVFCVNASEQAFVHDGHRNCDSVVTHLWHPESPELIFSADICGELQGWKFKTG